jgi:hypothetical protein
VCRCDRVMVCWSRFFCRGTARRAHLSRGVRHWTRHAVPLHLILLAAAIPAQTSENPLITELRAALAVSPSQEIHFAVSEGEGTHIFAVDPAMMATDRARVFAYEAVERDGVTLFERLDARPELPGVQPFEISLREGAEFNPTSLEKDLPLQGHGTWTPKRAARRRLPCPDTG